mgnify:CR=1 FL=1
MKKLIQLKLKVLARMIVAKYKPRVVGITGSVGKTSAKEAVYTVLNSKFKVRRSRKNYNNELGVPLTIIGAGAPGRSVFGWCLAFLKAGRLLFWKDKNYPEILILELGVDRPGDMDYLMSIVKCDIGLVTSVGVNHLEFFKSEREIQKEKGRLIENLKKGGWAILNYDNKKTRELSSQSTSKVLTFGFSEKAGVRAQNIIFKFEEDGDIEDMSGISFKLNYKGSVVPIALPRVIGYSAIYAALAGAAAGVGQEMNLVEISKALKDFYLPPGRMNLIKGIKHTLIIDDSYNSSPQSAISALEFIRKIDLGERGRKWAVLGDMMELGSYTEEGHREVGKKLVETGFDKLVTVGERARDMGRAAREAGLRKEDVFNFADSEEAGRFIQERMEEDDLLLIKGSQSVRMEKIVKEIMADPLNAKNLLVRQSEDWLNR